MKGVETVTVTDETVLYLAVNGWVGVQSSNGRGIVEPFTIQQLHQSGQVTVTLLSSFHTVLLDRRDGSVSFEQEDEIDMSYDSIGAWLDNVSDGRLNYQPSTPG